MIAILLQILFPHSRISGNNYYYNKCKWHYYPQYIPFYIIRLLLLVETKQTDKHNRPHFPLTSAVI